MSEALVHSQEKPRVVLRAQPEIASRAVALCEGCPMAKFCATKSTGDCPPPVVKREMLEMVRDSGPEALPQASYRTQLLDDSIPSVTATLRRVAPVKKQMPRPTHLELPRANPRPVVAKPTPEVKHPPRRPRHDSEMTAIGKAVADIVGMLFGGAPHDGARAKK